MDGATMEVGAVGAMRYVKDGIKAARLVMQYTEHTLLVGEQASAFAISMVLPGPKNLSSEESLQKWMKWKEGGCEPNFWKNVSPSNSCGPYHPKERSDLRKMSCSAVNLMETTTTLLPHINVHNHDTIAMAVIDNILPLDSESGLVMGRLQDHQHMQMMKLVLVVQQEMVIL